MDTTTNQVISRTLVCVWVTGIAFPPNWTTLPHGQHMYTWSPASWKSGQPSTTRLCHTLDNHPDNHPLAGQKHIKLPALTSVGILGNDYYWIDGKGSIVGTQRNKHVIITSKRRFDAIITCLLRFVFAGRLSAGMFLTIPLWICFFHTFCGYRWFYVMFVHLLLTWINFNPSMDK